jgi:thioredoxin-related protein
MWLASLAVVAVVVAACERETQPNKVTVSRTIAPSDDSADAMDRALRASEPVEADSLYTVARYDPQRDPAEDLAKTVRVAQQTNKRILLQVGGEWCGWCHRLDNFIAEHSAVSQAIGENFVIMKVNFSDDNRNEAFLAQYPPIPGYPHLYVLKRDGTLLHSQNTVELEEGSSYSEAALLAFFDRWKAG